MSGERDVLADIEWTPDCQGKQDFDGDIVCLSTRYWPRGGGFSVFTPSTGAWEGNADRPEIRPSAKSTIMVLGDDWIEAEFEADSEAEVKALVEKWARTQIADVINALARHREALRMDGPDMHPIEGDRLDGDE